MYTGLIGLEYLSILFQLLNSDQNILSYKLYVENGELYKLYIEKYKWELKIKNILDLVFSVMVIHWQLYRK